MEVAPPASRELLAATSSAILAQQSKLALLVINEMYLNPFWQARYGAPGRVRSLEDSNYNLSQLAGAMALDIPDEVRTYYRWLQKVLVLRGMTTEHVRDALSAMTRVLTDNLAPEQAAVAAAWLKMAQEALTIDYPFAEQIATNKDALLASALQQLSGQLGTMDKDIYASELNYQLSYLGDAITFNRDDLFTSYIAWISKEETGFSVDLLVAGLRALGDQVEAKAPEYAEKVQQLIEDGIEAIQGASKRG